MSLFFFSFIHTISFSQSISLLGQINPIPTAVPFLEITPDARAGAMGDAGCASTPDAWSNYWNASKNAFIKKDFGIAVAYTPWLRALIPDLNLVDMSLYKKVGKNGNLEIFNRYFSWGDVANYSLGFTNGKLNSFDYAGNISYSHRLSEKFSVGGTLKYIYSNQAGINPTQTRPGQSIAADISCYWKDTVNFLTTKNIFAWGINISNVGSKISYANTGEREFLPQNLRIGISYKMNMDEHNSIELICDANKLLAPTPTPASSIPVMGKDPNQSVMSALFGSFHDAPGGYQEELKEINIASGIEYWYAKMLAVRIGYFYEDPTKGGRKYITLGVGGRYASFTLDLSYLIPTEVRNPLQNTMRFTLAYEFGSHGKGTKKKFVD